MATDNVEKVPLFDRVKLVKTIGEVVERKTIVVSYSNDVEWEVQINCSDPAGNLLVKYDIKPKEKKNCIFLNTGSHCTQHRAQPTLHGWLAA